MLFLQALRVKLVHAVTHIALLRWATIHACIGKRRPIMQVALTEQADSARGLIAIIDQVELVTQQQPSVTLLREAVEERVLLPLLGIGRKQ
ncbi:hypothetical protein D3C72_2184010 [compost metagenome]